MPRQPRLDARPLPSSGFQIPEFRRIGNSPEGEADIGQAPGALHHVMGRGIDGVKIFINRKDHEENGTLVLKQLMDRGHRLNLEFSCLPMMQP